jgi:HlyD family secretion protein
LYDRGVIAKAQFENFDFDYKNSIQAEISFRKSQLSQWESQKRSIQEKIQQQTGTINQLNSEEVNYYIIAPSNGTIERFIGIQEGSFVSPQQPIAYISPNNNLIVENLVSPKDIGLIRMNQKVKFQLDAFNYNQWGLLEGKVIDIDNNLSTDNNQAYFKVRCVILKNELKLKTGYKTKASKGMTVTTRFMITRRSLYDLLFDKVDDWLNPKIL